MLEDQERKEKKRKKVKKKIFYGRGWEGKKGLNEPPAVPSATWVVPEQPKEVVSEGPSGKP